MTTSRPVTPRVLAVQARISEATSKDVRGVLALRDALADLEPTTVVGRDGPLGQTAWQEDLAASLEIMREAGEHVSRALAAGERPVVLASDCAIALGTLPAALDARPEAKVLWLDSHSDFDTPETTQRGFLACMSLSGACGVWDSGLGSVPPERVVLCGARSKDGDFDIAGHREAESSPITMVDISSETVAEVCAALGDAPVYVHLDADVLDPADFPIYYGREGGLTAGGLAGLLAAVVARGPVIGVETTGFHSDDDAPERARMTKLLAGALDTLLDAP